MSYSTALLSVHRAALGLLPIVAGATQPPKCRAASNKLGGIAAPPHVDRDGTVLPQDLPDVRSEAGILPADLNQAAYMKAEGSTYFWYACNRYCIVRNVLVHRWSLGICMVLFCVDANSSCVIHMTCILGSPVLNVSAHTYGCITSSMSTAAIAVS